MFMEKIMIRPLSQSITHKTRGAGSVTCVTQQNGLQFSYNDKINMVFFILVTFIHGVGKKGSNKLTGAQRVSCAGRLGD